jgi:hypothetical protein
LDGKLLKKKSGPFYPILQRDLDGLVGSGVVLISGLGHVLNEDKQWRLEGSYRLNRSFGARIVDRIRSLDVERRLLGFQQELAYAFSALSDAEMDNAIGEDATYSSPLVDFGNVIDFSEWQRRNYSANAAERFESLLPDEGRATSAEKLHLYLRHLKAILNG